MWGVGLGLCVQGKPGAAKGRVVLGGGLAAERGSEQLGGGGGVYGHRAELLVTCGNAGDGQRNGNAIAGGAGSHGRGMPMMAGRPTWSTPAHNLRSLKVPPASPPPGPTPETPRPHGRPAKPPQAGRTPPVGLSGGRATTCGQRPQRRQGDMRTVSGRGMRVHQAGRAPRAVGAGRSSSSSSATSTVAMSSM